MTRLPESSSWEEDIELISRNERVSGGLDGVANRPLKSLANRTRFLKKLADESGNIIEEKISAVKTFTDGATLESPREEILYGAYRLVWTGAFPKIIPMNSSPETTGGIGAGVWAYTSDAIIRQDLGSISRPGASLVSLGNGSVADAILYKTPEMFGAKGDGSHDDSTAIQAAASWLCSGSNRHLIFSSGKVYRLAAPVTFTFPSGVKCCAIEMHGAIKPDGGVGDAFTINDAVGCDFKLNVLGDGVSISIDGTTGAVTLPDGFPDYSLPDPSDSQQAFVFNSCRSVRIDAVGYGYAGRVLRTKSTRSLKTSFLDISIRTGDSATVIGSGQCGQAMYLEGGSDAFGIINIAQTNWDVYGSVVYKLADLSIAYWENGSGYANASMTFIGCQTVHAGIIASGGVNQKYPSIVISDTSDRPTIGFSIQRLFCVTGNNNLVLEGLGSDDALRKSVTINSFYSIQAAADGAVINGMSNVEINNVHIDNVQTGIRIKGLVRNVRVSGYIKNPATYGIISDSDAEIHEFYFNGRILSASSTLDCVNFTAGNVLTATFRDCYIFATHGAFNLSSSNDVKIIGGSHSAVTMFPGSRPAIIKDTSGFISAKRGRTSFPVGSLTGAKLIVTHGLSLAPTSVTLTPLGAVSGANLSISTSDGLTFTVTYTGPTLSTIFEFRWRADCELV
ncbi:tail fiber/spike domain-containing protein [Klebsiella michiganensis]|uniref:tail fiber/spike domain-containing protein n=1 Tax=Klebsiella michiganensis TaxID=1134687 RepID=UPI00227B93D3|nr:hypothetical protein [Klebsiella michiganensis]MCY3511295.1 hypothetical protein [Klebsiella michiganensis]